jgi:hypothetical protein
MSKFAIFNPFLPPLEVTERSLKNVYFIQAEYFTFPLEVTENHLTACKRSAFPYNPCILTSCMHPVRLWQYYFNILKDRLFEVVYFFNALIGRLL